VISMMARGNYDTAAMVSAEYPLERTAEAFTLLDKEPPDVVKVLIKAV